MGKRILVVDDDEAVRKFFARIFRDTLYEIVLVESGEKGLGILEKERVDLVFLDLNMESMDGVQTLREIRKLNKKIPVYLMTAFAKEYFDSLNDAVKDKVVFELLNKPISAEQIMIVAKSRLEEV